MTKLDTRSVSLEVPSSSYRDLEAARRLIVLVPSEADYTRLTHRIWELAHASGCQVLFISLCADEMQEASVRRQLITMSAMVQDGRICAESRVEVSSDWVHAIRSDLQDGDMIVCFAEQRTGILRKPLSQVLQATLNVPIYILDGLAPQDFPQPNLVSEILGWTGSLGILVGAFLFQVRITALAENWAQTTLLILSVIGEILAIWGWNSLFS